MGQVDLGWGLHQERVNGFRKHAWSLSFEQQAFRGLLEETESERPKSIAVQLPDDTKEFLEQEAKETSVPLSNLMSYIAVNYLREEKKRRSQTNLPN